MGNFISSKQKTDETVFKNFYEVIDYVASYYILKSDFKSLKKLNDTEYCNKLVVITSDVIKNAFNTRDIQFIAKRVKDGLEVNEMTSNNYTYMTHDQLDGLDIKNTQPDIILSTTYTNPNGVEESIDIPITATFFWPDARI